MMKKRLKKGSYGYIRAYKKYHLIVSAVCFLIVTSVFLAGLIIFKTKLNYCTLAAMLLLLPSVKAWIASIVMIPYHTDIPEHFEKIKQLMDKKTAYVFSDLVMTKYEGSMMVSVLVLYDDNFFAYVPKKQRKSAKEIKAYLDSIIKEAGSSSKSLVFDKFELFEKKIESLSSQEDRAGKKTEALKKQLFVPLV